MNFPGACTMSFGQTKFRLYNFQRAALEMNTTFISHVNTGGKLNPTPLPNVLTFGAVGLCLLLTLLLLELHVPVVHHGSCELIDPNFLLRAEAQDVNGILRI